MLRRAIPAFALLWAGQVGASEAVSADGTTDGEVAASLGVGLSRKGNEPLPTLEGTLLYALRPQVDLEASASGLTDAGVLEVGARLHAVGDVWSLGSRLGAGVYATEGHYQGPYVGVLGGVGDRRLRLTAAYDLLCLPGGLQRAAGVVVLVHRPTLTLEVALGRSLWVFLRAGAFGVSEPGTSTQWRPTLSSGLAF